MRMLLACFVALFWFQPALAIDPGTVEGSLQIDDESVPLRHSYAHLHDNAEGLLDTPQEMRILLCDREVPEESLAGIAFLPIEAMAKEGGVRGLLLQFDPDAPGSVVVTVLLQPADRLQSLPTQTLSATGKPIIEGWQQSATRVSGTIACTDTEPSQFEEIPKLVYSLRFSAPLFHEPAVTADLKGKEAIQSPQAAVSREKARALARGDWNALKRISSPKATRELDVMLAGAGKEAKTLFKPLAAEMNKAVQRAQRVVVRGDRAVMILPDKQWFNFVREGGVWKTDD